MTPTSKKIHNLRVLLVEDNAFDLNLERTGLRELGCRDIVVAYDGTEAFNTLAAGSTYDLIISDWNMPEFDGLQLFLAARERWPDVPFMMLTNNDSAAHVRKAMIAGVDSYLVKPFSVESLREKIVLALEPPPPGGRRAPESPDEGRRPAGSPVGDHIRKIETEEDFPAKSELTAFLGAIDSAFADPADLARQAGVKGGVDDLALAADELMEQGLRLGHDLVPQIVGQLVEFMGRIDAPTPLQVEVMKLHVESIHAIFSGRGALSSEENHALLLDGLRSAIEKVRD